MTTALETERTTPTRTASLVWFDDLLTRSGRRCVSATLEQGDTVASILERHGFIDAGDARPLAVVINGVAAPSGLIAFVRPGDCVTVAPRPQGLETVALVGIALASLALSVVLAPKVKSSIPTNGGTPEEQRPGFSRVSNDAVAGDTIQVLMGEHPAYGGKVIAIVPTDDALGTGTSRLKELISFGRGELSEIAGLSTSSDDVASTSAALRLKLNGQAIANFPGSRVSARLGTSGQGAIAGFRDTELLQEVGVGGVTLRNTSGSERTGSSASAEAYTVRTTEEVDNVIVRVRFPGGLYRLSDSGQLEPQTVRYRVRVRPVDSGGTPGTWSAWSVLGLVKGERSEFVSAPRYGSNLGMSTRSKYDVQLERVSVETGSTQVVDEMTWEALVGVRLSSNTYAGFGVLALDLEATEQLNSTPQVTAAVKGIKVRVHDGVSSPSSPVFTTAYSNCPADLALEAITNAVWGMGTQYTDANVDFASLLEWRATCIELVQSTLDASGWRPRYTCNLVIDSSKDAWEWLQIICETGRCRPVWNGSKWIFVYDGPRQAVELITDGTIATDSESGGGFAKLNVHYEDTTDGYQQSNRLVAQIVNARADGRVDTIAWPPLGTLWLATEDVVEETVSLPGITDPEQAFDELRYRLKKQRLTQRTATLSDARPVIASQPGDRVDVACSLLAWGNVSGRVLDDCTTSQVRIDRTIALDVGTDYVVRIQHTDGTIEAAHLAMASDVYPPGTPLDLASTLTQAPALGAVYSIGVVGVEVKPFIVDSVSAKDDGGALLWSLGLREYDPEIYEADDVITPPPVYSVLPTGKTPPGPVIGLKAYQRRTSSGWQVELAWSQRPADASITSVYRVYRRVVGTTTWLLAPLPSITRRSAVLDIIDDGRGYDLAVVAVSIQGSALSPYDPSVPRVTVVLGLSAGLPATPTGLTATAEIDGAYTLAWDAVDGAVGYVVLTGGAVTSAVHGGAEDCFVLARTVAPQLTGVRVPAGQPARWWVRSVNSTGRMSDGAASVNVSSAVTPPGKSIKETREFDFVESGTLDNLTYNGTTSRLELTDPANPGSWTSIEIDTGSLTLGRLSVQLATANDTDDPTIADAPMTAPSVEADQWGIVSTSPKTVGMLWQPYPDDAISYQVEVRTYDGVIWSSWTTLAAAASIERMIEMYQVRVTLARSRAPYRPALRGVVAVITD